MRFQLPTSTGDFTGFLNHQPDHGGWISREIQGTPQINGTHPLPILLPLRIPLKILGKPMGRGGPIIGGFPYEKFPTQIWLQSADQATTPHKRERHLQTSSRDASNDVPVAGYFGGVSST